MYDPALGRWMTVDHESDRGPHFSPYNYSFNNPIRYLDPDGDWPWEAKGIRQARQFARATGGKFYKNGDGTATVNIYNTATYWNLVSRHSSRNGYQDLEIEEIKGYSMINFEGNRNYDFLFERPKEMLANGAISIVINGTLVFVPPGILLNSDGTINIEALLQFAQHGKNDHKLDDEQVARLKDVLNDSNATKKEKNTAKQKLKRNEKATDERPSRQSKDKKSKKEKDK